MRIVEISEQKLDLTSFDSTVDADVLFDLAEEKGLVITLFGDDLKTLLRDNISELLEMTVSRKLKREARSEHDYGSLGWNNKHLLELLFDTTDKELFIYSALRGLVHYNAKADNYATFKIWIVVSKDKTKALEKDDEPSPAKIEKLKAEGIDLHGFLGREAWA